MNASTLNHLWDFAIPAQVESSQVWILSAMKSHGPALVRMLWRILGCEQKVCDAYQDTFLKLAHHNFGSRPEKVKSYLFKTASNVAISMIRREALHDRYVEKVFNRQNEQSDPNDFDHQQCCSELRMMVAKLPPHLREVIILRDFGEISYRQVGKILNITETTARVYRCKAVQLLAIWLNSEQTK